MTSTHRHLALRTAGPSPPCRDNFWLVFVHLSLPTLQHSFQLAYTHSGLSGMHAFTHQTRTLTNGDQPGGDEVQEGYGGIKQQTRVSW